MNTIILVILFLIIGVFIGFILARIIFSISKYFSGKKAEKEIFNEPKNFFYNQTPYDLKEEIEFEKNKKKKKSFRFFKKKVKGGISDYGERTEPRFEPVSREQVFSNDRGVKPTEQPSTSSATAEPRATREQEYSTPAEPRGEPRGNFNRNLFKKSK
jgi:hypothetical protein